MLTRPPSLRRLAAVAPVNDAVGVHQDDGHVQVVVELENRDQAVALTMRTQTNLSISAASSASSFVTCLSALERNAGDAAEDDHHRLADSSPRRCRRQVVVDQAP